MTTSPTPATNGTRRLAIRLLERRDIEEARILHNDDATLARLTDVTHVTEPQQEAWFQSVSTSRTSRRYVARRRDDDAFVGLFRVDRIDLQNRNCLVGCDIVPSLRRQGHAREFYGYMLDYLFLQLGLHRVGLVTLADNDGALALYRALGFAEEGREREAIFRSGRFHDLVAMGLLASEWRRGDG
jgi:RimJ/RimL family protein N-acetyltransferase